MKIRLFAIILGLSLGITSLLLAKDAHQYFVEGNMHFNNGEYDQAIIKFKKAIAQDPEFAPAYYNIGVVYHHKGKAYYPIAAKWYKKALEKNNRLTNAYYNLGVIYFSLEEYEQALEHFQKAKELNPKDSTIQKALDLTNQEIAEKKKKTEIKEEKEKEEVEKKSLEPSKSIEKETKKTKEEKTKREMKKEVKKEMKKETKVKAQIKKVEPILSARKEKETEVKSRWIGDITFCHKVVNRQPVNKTDVFKPTDEKVVLWIKLINIRGKHTIETKWYDPKNFMHFHFKYPFEAKGDRYRFWAEKKIAGTPAAHLKGEWQVLVLLDGKEITKASFTLK